MTKWEYLTIVLVYRDHEDSGIIERAATGREEVLNNVLPSEWEENMNKLGDDGWELVNVVAWDDGYAERYSFKRPK